MVGLVRWHCWDGPACAKAPRSSCLCHAISCEARASARLWVSVQQVPPFYLWRCSREKKYQALSACTSSISRSEVEEPGNEASRSSLQLHTSAKALVLQAVQLNNKCWRGYGGVVSAFLGKCVSIQQIIWPRNLLLVNLI